MNKFLLLLILFLSNLLPHQDFRTAQLNYPRVKTAFAEKEIKLKKALAEKSIQFSQLEIYLRVFKEEKHIEVWAKNRSDKKFSLFCTYAICASSGTLGPKYKAGDGQVPEGFYTIERFNPFSNYLLSLGISYPNAADQKRSNAKNLGGDIFIHGSCVTIGCMPITDDKIKELYVLAVTAYANGETKIPVHIFPCL